MKLLLIMPAKNASSERSYSVLRRDKNYWRNTMCQQRLNNLMVLHVHKELTNSIKLEDIANEFVGDSHHRVNLFGQV